MARYSDKQIQFIIDGRRAGLEWEALASAFNSEFKDELESLRTWDSIRSTYRRYSDIFQADDHMAETIRGKYAARRRASLIARENKVLLDEQLGYQNFIDDFKETSKKTPIRMFKQPALKHRKVSSRTIVLHLSDTHLGVNIRKSELGGVNEFNSTIAARRMSMVAKEVCEYKIEHRDSTDLVIVLNGDLIAGVIHSLEGGVQNLSNQYLQAIRYLISFVSYCCAHFQKVSVYTTVGNHGRFTHKGNKGQQTDAKFDSHETNIHIAVREALLPTHRNLSFHIVETPYVMFECQGHTFFATHGDTVLKVGNVSKSISMDKIKNAVNDIQVGLSTSLDVVMVGHVHKQTFQTLDCGTEVLINGCLSGVDSFAQSIGIFSNNPAQQIFEVTKEFAVGDVRFIRVKGADGDSKLDKIIQPVKDELSCMNL